MMAAVPTLAEIESAVRVAEDRFMHCLNLEKHGIVYAEDKQRLAALGGVAGSGKAGVLALLDRLSGELARAYHAHAQALGVVRVPMTPHIPGAKNPEFKMIPLNAFARGKLKEREAAAKAAAKESAKVVAPKARTKAAKLEDLTITRVLSAGSADIRKGDNLTQALASEWEYVTLPEGIVCVQASDGKYYVFALHLSIEQVTAATAKQYAEDEGDDD